MFWYPCLLLRLFWYHFLVLRVVLIPWLYIVLLLIPCQLGVILIPWIRIYLLHTAMKLWLDVKSCSDASQTFFSQRIQTFSIRKLSLFLRTQIYFLWKGRKITLWELNLFHVASDPTYFTLVGGEVFSPPLTLSFLKIKT